MFSFPTIFFFHLIRTYFSNWYHILARSDPDAPKHRGITYFAMKFKDDDGNMMPGITLRPLYDFFGTRRWNELFMDEVRVPKNYLIGVVNRSNLGLFKLPTPSPVGDPKEMVKKQKR